ncbi:MAG TPA: type II toxin-antitoxin system HicB family antitoxin, partial [Hyphomicrobiales bacterium]|nr:type II toxin-antitoxin system HicB family antitoxin [Hyphomicrobiales bacterium]
ALQGRIRARQPIAEPRANRGIEVPLSPLAEAKLALYRAFLDSGLTKAELARRLGWHGPSIDRLFDLGHDSRIGQIGAAVAALGREMRITTLPAA